MLDGPVATIDLTALGLNLRSVQDRLKPGVGVLAAVKADGYGHGAVPVARRLEELGATWFGVATPDEALRLRAGGVRSDILLFGPAYRPETIRRLADENVALTVADDTGLEALRAARLAGPLRVHLKVDTGMGRLGRPWTEAAALGQAVARQPGLQLEGVWTHLARSDEPTETATAQQLERFERALGELRRNGLEPALRHAANSAAVFAYPEAQYDLVRPGIALYGHHSSPAIAALEPRLRPVMRLQAPVTFVKRVARGTPVSYGATWTAPRDTVVATVRIGYADGYPRALSGLGSAAWNGRSLPIAGRVCMDQLLLDAGDAAIGVGDTVTLWGPSGPDAERLAQLAGTVSYELLTGVSPRVERRYQG